MMLVLVSMCAVAAGTHLRLAAEGCCTVTPKSKLLIWNPTLDFYYFVMCYMII